MMHRSTPHLSAETRDLRRDRSIIALAAALCGALSAAGIAALAVVSQLAVDPAEEALSDATAALVDARQELARSREQLTETRLELASASAWRSSQRHSQHHGQHHGQHHSQHHSQRHGESCDRHGSRPSRTVVTTMPLGAASSTLRFQLTSARPPAPPPVAHPSLNCDEEHRCTVQRDFLDAALFGAEGARSRARVVPRIRDGAPVGMTIFAVRHGDPAELLGFRDRDTILALNGQPWRGKSLREMLDHAREVRAERPDSLTITLERGGEEVTKHFDLLP